VSGAGFNLPNFYTETSDIAIREERTDDQDFRQDPLLEQPLMKVCYSFKAPSSIKRSWLTDLDSSSLVLFFVEDHQSFGSLLLAPHVELSNAD
jgi:DNA-binding transcriptional LysR family regulator